MAKMYGFHVGKYSSPVDPMGRKSWGNESMVRGSTHRLMEDRILEGCRFSVLFFWMFQSKIEWDLTNGSLSKLQSYYIDTQV